MPKNYNHEFDRLSSVELSDGVLTFEPCQCGRLTEGECLVYCIKHEAEQEEKTFKIKQSKKGESNDLRNVSRLPSNSNRRG